MEKRTVWGFFCPSVGTGTCLWRTFSSRRAAVVELLAAGQKRNPVNLLVINPLGTTIRAKNPKFGAGEEYWGMFEHGWTEGTDLPSCTNSPMAASIPILHSGDRVWFGG